MNFNQTINALSNVQKGAYIVLEWCRNVKVLKGYEKANGTTIVKKSCKGVFRLGVAYANLKENIEKETGPLLYGHYVEGFPNYIIEHNGKFYLRITVSKNPNHKTKSTYTINGTETTKEFLQENKIISSSNSNNDLLVFNVNIEDITRIGTYEAE